MALMPSYRSEMVMASNAWTLQEKTLTLMEVTLNLLWNATVNQMMMMQHGLQSLM
jgi:hypothetical protein